MWIRIQVGSVFSNRIRIRIHTDNKRITRGERCKVEDENYPLAFRDSTELKFLQGAHILEKEHNFFLLHWNSFKFLSSSFGTFLTRRSEYWEKYFARLPFFHGTCTLPKRILGRKFLKGTGTVKFLWTSELTANGGQWCLAHSPHRLDSLQLRLLQFIEIIDKYF